MPHVTLTGDITGDYLVDERRPDGSLVLHPDTSVTAILRRTGGGRLMTSEEFAQHFGDLPTDGEG